MADRKIQNSLQLKENQLEDLVLELKKWSPIPYPLVYVAKHELQCHVGMLFFVDTWPSCNAIVAIPSATCDFPFMEKAVFLDAKDPEKLLDILRGVPIDWTKDFYFSAIYEYLRPVCEKASQEHGTLFGDILEHTMVQKESTNLKSTAILGDYKIGTLSLGEASTVMQEWKFTGNFSRGTIQHRVEHSIQFHPNIAIRDKENSLIAYEMISPHGTMGMLNVFPEHRGKGLGSAIVGELSRQISNEGDFRYCHVGEENPVSIKLHKKCGFVIEEGSDILWIFFKPNK